MNNYLINKACIIDDDKLYISLIKRIIEKDNLAKELLVFENGKQAYAYFKEHIHDQKALPNIVLLDLNMPIMDGWEFLDVMEHHASELEKYGVSFSFSGNAFLLNNNNRITPIVIALSATLKMALKNEKVSPPTIGIQSGQVPLNRGK